MLSPRAQEGRHTVPQASGRGRMSFPGDSPRLTWVPRSLGASWAQMAKRGGRVFTQLCSGLMLKPQLRDRASSSEGLAEALFTKGLTHDCGMDVA